MRRPMNVHSRGIDGPAIRRCAQSRATPHVRAPRSRAHRNRRGAALYTAVLATSLLIALLGLTAIQIAAVERRSSDVITESLVARENARAAVELALQDLWTDSSWRTRYTHNVETTQLPFGGGTVSWRLKDVGDSSLSDDPADSVEVLGIGRFGNAACVHSVTVQPIEREIGPIELRGYLDDSNLSTEVVSTTKWWAQYFRPYLPSGASSWRVTAVDLLVRQEGTVGGSTTVSLFQPQSNLKPSTTLIDQATINESVLPTSLQYVRAAFAGHSGLSPTSGLCLTLTTSSGTPMRFAYDSSGVSAANTAFVDGNPAWQNVNIYRSMLYRVTGMYSVRTLQVVPNSWKRAALP